MTDYKKYKKKKNCDYPFSPEPAGYCWGYASSVDMGETDKQVEDSWCLKCEYFTKKGV